MARTRNNRFSKKRRRGGRKTTKRRRRGGRKITKRRRRGGRKTTRRKKGGTVSLVCCQEYNTDGTKNGDPQWQAGTNLGGCPLNPGGHFGSKSYTQLPGTDCGAQKTVPGSIPCLPGQEKKEGQGCKGDTPVTTAKPTPKCRPGKTWSKNGVEPCQTCTDCWPHNEGYKACTSSKDTYCPTSSSTTTQKPSTKIMYKCISTGIPGTDGKECSYSYAADCKPGDCFETCAEAKNHCK